MRQWLSQDGMMGTSSAEARPFVHFACIEGLRQCASVVSLAHFGTNSSKVWEQTCSFNVTLSSTGGADVGELGCAV